MAVAYTWAFSVPMVAPSENGFANVVKQVPYTLTANDGVNPSVSVSGWIGLPPATPGNFVPFASITKAQVIAWCAANLNVPLLQANLAASLGASSPPALVPMTLPGANLNGVL